MPAADSHTHPLAGQVEGATWATLKRLTKRCLNLDEEISGRVSELEALVAQAETALTGVKGP